MSSLKPYLFAVSALVLASSQAFASSNNEDQFLQPDNYRFPRLRGIGADYLKFKKILKEKYGFDYSFTTSFTGQYGAPGGHVTSLQTALFPSFSWQFLNNEHGKASLNFAYNIVQYTGANSGTIDNNIGVVSSINDFDEKTHELPKFYIDYTLPASADWLTIGFGQYPISMFDSISYASYKSENFVNWNFSTNASASYPSAGVGTYFRINPEDTWNLVLGFQDATNVDGNDLSVSNLGEGHYATFGVASYTPTFTNLGAGQYSLMLYHQPWVKAQPQTTQGYSFSMAQNLGDKWTVFGRINGVSGNVEDINRAYLLGVAVNNPFNRNPLDQIGFAGALNHIDKDALSTPATHNYEKVFDTYMTFGVSQWMTITPDFQFYLDPAANPTSDTAFVFSLDVSLFF